MNLYSVLSNETVLFHPGSDMEPEERGTLFALVAANSRSQARWIAWRDTKHAYRHDRDEMFGTVFSIRLKRKNIGSPSDTPRICTDDPEWQNEPDIWEHAFDFSKSVGGIFDAFVLRSQRLCGSVEP